MCYYNMHNLTLLVIMIVISSGRLLSISKILTYLSLLYDTAQKGFAEKVLYLNSNYLT